MIKRIFIVIGLLSTFLLQAQDKTSSPYSYFGIGLPAFNGSAASMAMEGLSIGADSTHYNFQNPAALGKLQLTTFAVGVSQKNSRIESGSGKESSKNTSFDYLAVGIPIGKLNFAFGINPSSTVGYRFQELTTTRLTRFEGNGGLNKLFLAFGYDLSKEFQVGIETSYHFGKIKNTVIHFQDEIQYGTRERNRSDLQGFQMKLGLHYAKKLSEDRFIQSGISYTPKAKLNSENQRFIGAAQFSPSGGELISNEQEISLGDTKFDLPASFRLGVGYGKYQKWMIGAEYENIEKTDYKNTSFVADNVDFNALNIYRLGGYFIPNYNDNNYFNRIIYRAGMRYQDTGLTINQSRINEFGMSFGLGLPTGPYMGNLDLGVEYGERGKTHSGLVKEKFVNIFIGLSLNDKWFTKRKFN